MIKKIRKNFLKITVITGDHYVPDPEKPQLQFTDIDFKTHQAMVEAFKSFQDLQVDVINDHSKLITQISKHHPDLIVNFCDTGFYNKIALEPHLPALFELLGIPYTGATPATIILCYDKAMIRLVAQSLHIPVPNERFFSADESLEIESLDYPSLIKPNCADGSLGITKDAVVKNKKQAEEYLIWLKNTLPDRDILIQEYLSGPEYSIGLIGNTDDLEALPILEVDYSQLPSDLNPILSYESKSLPDSPYWTDIRYKKAEIDSDKEKKLIEAAKKLFKRFKFRDYGRFDFRQSANGEIKLLEVNPNPAWAYDGKLALMAGFAEIAYRDFLKKILDAACRRIEINT